MIIGLAGKKRSGKDTVADYLCREHNFTKYAFGDPVKNVCHHLLGFSFDQLYGNDKEKIDERIGMSPREAMQKIGTEFGREYIHTLFPSLNVDYGQIWIYHFQKYLNENKGKNIVISDVRFENELDSIVKNGGKVFFIDSYYCQKNDGHLSESFNISMEKYQGIIENKGTLEELFNNSKNTLNL